MATKLCGAAMCAACVQAAPKGVQRYETGSRSTHDSVTFKCVFFSSQLANIRTEGVGMPTVPYWLPAVTQEDGKMVERGQGRVQRRLKGVAMTRGHEPPRLLLSLLLLICLSDDGKQHGSTTRGGRVKSEGV